MINLQGDENSCPALEEVRSCSVSSCYHWVIQPKEECQLPVEATQPCGAGFMSQQVSCLRWDGSEVTDISLCGPGTRPRERVECHVPCPNDCIASGWSDWSVCPSLSCENLEMHPRIPLRQRNRTILAIAGRDGQVNTQPYIISLKGLISLLKLWFSNLYIFVCRCPVSLW